MWKNRPASVFAILVGLSLTGCTSVPEDPSDFEFATLYGMVYDGQNRSVSHAVVRLDQTMETITDINGRFSFTQVAKGRHELGIWKDSFEVKTMSFEFQNRTEVVYLKIYSLDDHLDRAISSLASQDTAQAQVFLEKAQSIAADSPKYLYALALYQSMRGDVEAAQGLLSALEASGIRSRAILYLREHIENSKTQLEGGETK